LQWCPSFQPFEILDIAARACCNSRLQDGEQAPDLHVVFQRMPQVESGREPVMILAAHAFAFEVTAPFQVDHDPLHGPFGDQYFIRDVSNADIRPEKDAMQDVRVIAEKRPARVLELVCHFDHIS
jgi:hypothetical protein